MSIETQLYTVADLEEIANQPENLQKRFELYRGVIYEVPTPSPRHAWIIATLVRIIGTFLLDHRLGYVFADSVQYELPNGDVFIPDVSFISRQRQADLPAKFTIAPDLAVEVVSPSNRDREILDKVESYLESGTRRVWVIYPDAKVIDVYRRAEDGSLILKKFASDSQLDGEDVLPGFTLAVHEVFPT